MKILQWFKTARNQNVLVSGPLLIAKANKRVWITLELFTTWLRRMDWRFQHQKRKVVMSVANCPPQSQRIEHYKPLLPASENNEQDPAYGSRHNSES